MQEYVLLTSSEFKGDKLKNLIGQTFSMQNVLIQNKNVTLQFDKVTIKSKFDNIIKEDDENKVFILTTNNFIIQIQLKEYYQSESNK